MEDNASYTSGSRDGLPDFVTRSLRASLVAIKGSTATVLGSPYPMNSAEIRRFVRIIDDHADSLRLLIGNLADLRDMEAGTLSVDPEPASLGDLVEEAREAFLRRGGGNTILVDSAPNPPMVTVDRERIFRVLGILLADVSENSPPQHFIRVSLSWEERKGNLSLEIATEDGGDGVPGHAPGPFAQPAPEGGVIHGQGTAICRAIVEAHGGWLRDHGPGPEPGPRFTLTVPAGTAPAGGRGANAGNTGPGASASATQRSREGQLRVLAVDPDPVSRSHTWTMLLEEGFEAVVTGDPDRVEYLAGTERPHLFLVDAGPEIMERIARESDGPVLFMLEHGTVQDMERALDLGAADFILKPFTQQELAGRIRTAVRRGREPVQPEWPGPFVLGELTIDYAERTATVANVRVQLTATEFNLLSELSTNAGVTLTHEHLLRQVWGPLHQGDVRVLRTFIKGLRRKLGDAPWSPKYIYTAIRVGYRMPSPSGT